MADVDPTLEQQVLPSSIANYTRSPLSSDNVFRDNTAAQIAQQTPTLTGSVADGYTASVIVALAR